MNDQNMLFATGEGDALFDRNHQNLTTCDQINQIDDVSFLIETLIPFKNEINNVLEIGCSSGIKLESICNMLNAAGFGIDPSEKAVKSGNQRKKDVDIKLLVGTSEKLPFETGSFDLIYFAFCLYLFDRRRLFQSIAEADRVLKPGGFLVITDFDPGVQYKRPYSHLKGVFSYKQDYSLLYINSGLYYSVGKKSFSHLSKYFDVSHDERISCIILYKELHPYPLQI